jgi:putative Mg2+ transporter-C (MgtC) family protein
MPVSEWDFLGRVLLATVLGAAIGIERELRDKEAGLRTHMLVGLGSAMFMATGFLLLEEFVTNYRAVSPDLEALRLDGLSFSGNIITGIGFLGGAIIFRNESRAHGVTTAASIWATTAVGLACAAGLYILASGATVAVLIILYVVGLLEARLSKRIGDHNESQGGRA